jgi:anaerobic ribonucleoside-triphosphate reductase activating protein
MKYTTTEIVMREFPGEITLAINISGCPNLCEGCHSPELRQDIGKELNYKVVEELIEQNKGITCIGFMGGDAYTEELKDIFGNLRWYKPDIKIGWYSGRDYLDTDFIPYVDYYKFGSYQPKYGPLDSPTTNQVMLKWVDGNFTNITKEFLRKEI